MNQLWKPESWYPPLCPPKSLKKDLLQDEDFTEVDEAAMKAPISLNKSFDKHVQLITGIWNSDLRKLRSIFVWIGAQYIGCQQGTERHNPKYYFKEACENLPFISNLFAKMCRRARIPCILVKGKAKGAFYDPGDDDIKGVCTWALVYVADSWRFIFPIWAFVKVNGHEKGNWMLVENSGKAARQRFIANEGILTSDFDEFFFLTDPEEMNCICHPHDKEKQLLTVSWTQEKFFTLPYYEPTYFSSGWQLISPLTCIIKPNDGCCCIDFQSPGGQSKLNYKLFFDEGSSGKTFPQELQTVQYVKRLEMGRKMSLMVKIPVTGTYKLEVSGLHQGDECRLVEFRIVCDYVPETRLFPSALDTIFGFGDAAAEAGLSEPSHTERLVPVKSGEERMFDFKVKVDVDISARQVHFTRTLEELRDNIRGHREDDATVASRLSADDPDTDYFLEFDTFRNTAVENGLEKETSNAFEDLPISDTIFDFGEAASKAGLIKPSYTKGPVPVKSGKQKIFNFKVEEDEDILARQVHSTWTPEERRVNISKRREEDNATVTARLPADDPDPKYSLEIDTFKKTEGENRSEKEATNPLNDLLITDTVFKEAASEAGLTEPSYTERLVPVKSGEEKMFDFKVKEDEDILDRQVHFTRTPEELRDNISVRREEDNATVTARFPADDSGPEYSLEADTCNSTVGDNRSDKETTNVLNDLLTSDKALSAIITDKTKQKNLQVYEDGLEKADARELEKAAYWVSISGVKNPNLDQQIQTKKQRYKQLRKDALAAAMDRNFDQLNRALEQCVAVNLQYRGDVEAAMEILMELCKEETHKVLKRVKLQDLRECLAEISKTCVGEALQKEAWFQNALQIQRDVEAFEDRKQNVQLQSGYDLAIVYKPPDKVVDIIVATFILLGESKTELDTWQKIWTKLQETNECQIFTRMGNFDDSVLTQEQVDEAVRRLKKHDESFRDNFIAKTLHEWCSDRIKFHQLREKLNGRN